MDIYKVGGAVRDRLLGKPVYERDWVIVGATPQQMLDKGFKQVGKDFPVFLHPTTGEEYALARTERKTGTGYTGFSFDTSPNITLEDDLSRRDLTINAMAEDEKGELIDPYGGYQDLQSRLLRHVSQAFIEDPLRVLRVARFAARLPEFEVADETLELLKQIVRSGELRSLVAERVWQEWYKALQAPAPWRFFEVAEQCGALESLWPELHKQHYNWQAILRYTAEYAQAEVVRFASSVIEVDDIRHLGETWRIPSAYIKLAQLVQQHYRQFKQAFDAETILQLIESMDGLRRSQRFKEALTVIRCYWRCDNLVQQRIELLDQAVDEIKPITARYLGITHLPGPDIPQHIRQARLEAIRKLLN